ncbi:hypothetical protein L873DRAFT_1793607 [Choiromyces venosus 120613-1]|uniref:Uncharacterized protein n=1 Tax=Choiromyces venosus 120613-1 TaxID=1336337 RepID=A0A3N4J576_9PEZI|nr:hypothetical protein L873DRAFT_1793607 [Choiromyces venosus 120613-1]
MTDDQVSLVNPAPGPNFSDDEESAFSSLCPPPASETNQPSYQELATQINLLHETFQALQKHLLIFQYRHIQDTQALKDEVTALTSKVALLETQLQHQTTTPVSTLPTPQQQQQPPTWAQKVGKSLSSKPCTTPPNKIALPAVLTKYDHTIVIERDGTALPDTTNTLTIYDTINSAIKEPLIAMIEFTTNHHVLLITKDNTPATSVLKHHRFAIEEESEPPYQLPLASAKMKSGTRSYYMASPPPAPLLPSRQRLKNSTVGSTFPAFLDCSPQKPNIRTKNA